MDFEFFASVVCTWLGEGALLVILPTWLKGREQEAVRVSAPPKALVVI